MNNITPLFPSEDVFTNRVTANSVYPPAAKKWTDECGPISLQEPPALIVFRRKQRRANLAEAIVIVAGLWALIGFAMMPENTATTEWVAQ